MKGKIGLGMVGCGIMGDSLAQAAAATGRGRIAAVFDVDPTRRAVLAAKIGAEAALSEQVLLGRNDVQGVILATPPFLHCRAVLKAAAARKHIFLEKPMAVKASECDRMIAAARKAGIAFMVGQVLRYCEPFRMILRLSAKGAFGRPLYASIWRVGGGGYTRLSPWRASRKLSGGYLFEIGAHEIDFIRCLFGEPIAVHGEVTKKLPSAHEIEDLVAVQMRFGSGVVANYLGGTGFPMDEFGFCLRFEKATLRSSTALDPKALTVEYVKGGGKAKALTFGIENPVQAEIRGWLDSIRKGAEPPITGEDARGTVAVIEAAYKSAAKGHDIGGFSSI